FHKFAYILMVPLPYIFGDQYLQWFSVQFVLFIAEHLIGSGIAGQDIVRIIDNNDSLRDYLRQHFQYNAFFQKFYHDALKILTLIMEQSIFHDYIYQQKH